MRLPSVRRLLALCVVFSSIFTVYLLVSHRPGHGSVAKPWELSPTGTATFSQHSLTTGDQIHVESTEQNTNFNFSYNASRSVLIFTEYEHSKFMERLKVVLGSQRISYDVLTWNKFDDSHMSLPRLLTGHGKVKYSGFIFDNLKVYEELDVWTKSILQDFCRNHGLGIILLSVIDYKKEVEYIKLKDTQLWVKNSVKDLYDTELNPQSPILRMTKADQVLKWRHRYKHSVFWSNHSNYEPVSYSYRDSVLFEKQFVIDESVDKYPQSNVYRVNRSKYITVMYDKGELDGVKKVYFGGRVDGLWQYQLLFLDSLAILSRGTLGRPLTQWILVDIDDIFVEHKGARMKKEDVEALVMTQERLAKRVRNFHFNLGFSGGFFRRGTAEENEGDELLIEYAEKFWWFPHTHKHRKPHLAKSLEELLTDMENNLRFSQKQGIIFNTSYAVSPFHSGVYPVHEELYTAWKEMWDIKVTSTEEYPHLYPSWKRRGFIHKGIAVLPRQTAGLFTKNIYFSDYPKGRQRLEKSILGGELFMTIINNPISIFMTHFGNYGNDRLAPYTFETVVDFIKKWTNLDLVTDVPEVLAAKYFEFFPDDMQPIWQIIFGVGLKKAFRGQILYIISHRHKNPCNDSRHMAIWSPNKSCQSLPKCLVVGPQKTGTAALRVFMKLHPNLITSKLSHRFFEEIQFFSNKTNYARGLDWYMSYFPDINNSKMVYFEKSANYFDSPYGYIRASSLLPGAKIIILAADPALRAYSWYQHILSKKRKVAMKHSFYDVLTSNYDDQNIRLFQRRTLLPGLYATYLEKWLAVYPANQIMILDSEVLTKDPATALTSVQNFLGLQPFDFKKHITFSKDKGYFCPLRKDGRTRCLGPGKGRAYPRMDLRSERFLREYYRLPNMRFAMLLKKNNFPLPRWLRRQLHEVG